MVNSFTNGSPRPWTFARVLRSGPVTSPNAILAELTESDLGEVAGGINPQPLPPGVERDRI